MKQLLDDFFKKYKKQISIEELTKLFRIPKENTELLLDSLYELEKEGKIYFDKNKTYMHVADQFMYSCGTLKKSNSNQYYIKTKENNIIILKNIKKAKEGDIIFASIIKGVKSNHPKQFFGEVERIVKKENIKINSNYIIKSILKKDGTHFYINMKEERIYIPKENLNTAFAGDLVNAQVQNHTGTIIEVLKRHHQTHIFRCVKIKGKLKWSPISSSYGYYDLDNHQQKEGDLIEAEIKNKKLKLIKKIENNHTITDDINILVTEYGFRREFPKQVLEDSKKIKSIINEEILNDRKDLRNLETFTIDPKDAKDLDDAVSLEYKNNLYHLYVHAANPSHYIKFETPIFYEALKRGFSVYPTNSVIPMLPDNLSSEICSLNESGDKLALTCKMILDEEGNIKDFDIFKSIIHSNKQMNYDDVNKFLENPTKDHEYASFEKTLLRMNKLALILQKNKSKRGSITFENEEKQFILDELGNPISIQEKQRGQSQLMIENFMLLANETTSKFALYLDLPYIYRNHEKPTVQKKINLKNNLIQKGYVIQKIGNIDNPAILQRTLTNLLKGKSKEEKKIICEVFLKTMTRAFYDIKNIGHYGLALDCYGTFTSPARKISDLINHMIIEEFLTNGIESEKLKTYREFIKETCSYISEKQKDADLLEQEMEGVMLNKYAEKFLEQETKARILFINQSGIYVKENHGLTGMIPINKNMQIKGQKAIYQGQEYKKDDQITITLKERKNLELIFNLIPTKGKTLTKKKEN